jgi:hypothetical protein
LAGLKGYYAPTEEDLGDFCEEFEIDYMVANDTTFGGEFIQEGEYFFEPFDTLLAPRLKNQSSFALNEIPESEHLFSTGNLYVVPCPTSWTE